MIPKIYKNLYWLQSNPTMLKKISKGVEREALRVNSYGEIINNPYPVETIGSALTHKWITTDFSESLLEFITPNNTSNNYLLHFLQDIHKFVINNLNQEYLWPLSIPPFVNSIHSIKIAQYGKSNIGQLKTLYRNGLKNRYGPLMNIISGVHYNFSLPKKFWNDWIKVKNKIYKKNIISNGYLHLIRNFYKFGWIIPYLFGSSPAVESFFINKKKHNLKFKKHKELLYLPWSTSLRLSNIGHTNNAIKTLKLTFNSLHNYLLALNKGINIPSKNFSNLGLYDNFGNLKQINTNLLQTENELYTYIRPKRTLLKNQSLFNALYSKGIEYLEVRVLDINPFSCIGIEKNQILLLDLFLIWCVLADSPKISEVELQLFLNNWDTIILKGRKPKQKIKTNIYNCTQTVETIGKTLFNDFFYIAEILDSQYKNNDYQKACQKLILYFDHPELTFSEKILNQFLDNGIQETGTKISLNHKKKIQSIPLKILSNLDFYNETIQSTKLQKIIENNDKLNFQEYLNIYY